MTEPERVRIHYLRPPGRSDTFLQPLVSRDGERIITFMPQTPLPRPVRVGERVVLEDGSPVVWFTYPGRMHDVGCFHDAAGTLTGWYANVLAPVRFLSPLEWEATDLFLDVWLGVDGTVALLDADELEQACAEGSVSPALAERARAEADGLLAAARRGDFPGPEVKAWPLARVLAALGTCGGRAG
jgi:predicted RNA-binding protein associated with RNAse of E/G family